jgi:hypothetical protein
MHVTKVRLPINGDITFLNIIQAEKSFKYIFSTNIK